MKSVYLIFVIALSSYASGFNYTFGVANPSGVKTYSKSYTYNYDGSKLGKGTSYNRSYTGFGDGLLGKGYGGNAKIGFGQTSFNQGGFSGDSGTSSSYRDVNTDYAGYRKVGSGASHINVGSGNGYSSAGVGSSIGYGSMGIGYGNAATFSHGSVSSSIKTGAILLKNHLQIPPMETCKQGIKVPMNSHFTCDSGKCKIKCYDNYEYPDHRVELTIMCIYGRWVIQETTKFKELPECEPICSPKCENDGVCISPGVCKCGEKYHGKYCEEKQFICKVRPSVANALTSCVGTATSGYRKCIVQCNRGYKLNGIEKIDLKCLDGTSWTRSDSTSVAIFDDNCTPTCDPSCNNGGSCIAHNICNCPPKYAGSICQFEKSVCNITVVAGFNGGYNCKMDSETYTCTINCPTGIPFTSTPAASYTCQFAEGKFYPQPMPKCKYPESASITSSMYSKYQINNKKTSQSHSIGYLESEADKYQISGSSSGTINFSHKYGGYSQTNAGGVEVESTDFDFSKNMLEGKDYGGINLSYGSKSSGSINLSQALIDKKKWGFGYHLYKMPGIYRFSLKTPQKTSNNRKSALCLTWNGVNVKTFDGMTFQSPLLCSHTMVEDRIDGTFKVILRSCQSTDAFDCSNALVIYWSDFECVIENIDGQVLLSTPKAKTLPIPVKIVGIDITNEGRYIKINLETIGLKILWDKHKFVSFEAHTKLWDRTQGLCGAYDGDYRNDFVGTNGVTLKTSRAFIDTWSMYYPEEKNCSINWDLNFNMTTYEIVIKTKGEQIIDQLFSNSKLNTCFKFFNKTELVEFAMRDYYNCPNKNDRNICACESLAMLVAQCTLEGIEVEDGWRDLSICPIKCGNGRVFKQCGPSVERTCGSTATEIKEKCVEGCFCAIGTVLQNNVCISETECVCSQGGKNFHNGDVIQRDCNTCICKNGYWKCTEEFCGARCLSYGSSNFITFDGKEYNFRGKCSYIMFKSDKFAIEIEKDTFTNGKFKKVPATKSLLIKQSYKSLSKNFELKLGTDNSVYIDGRLIKNFPLIIDDGNIVIRYASSSFLTVEFTNGIRILWDRDSRAYIDVPSNFKNKTSGLCGSFNSNTKLDFLTPEGDFETAVGPFVDKWRVHDSCPANTESTMELHPCKENPHLKEKAIEHCTYLTGKLFEECHWAVSPTQFYENCLFDVCACSEDKLAECYCPIISSYNDECARHGIDIDSRSRIAECVVRCPIGQIYERKGSICARSCKDLSVADYCSNRTSVEGCRCPFGQLLNDEQECITEDQCPCYFDGMSFEPNYKEVRSGKYGDELCMCNKGNWECESSKPQDITLFPPYRGNCKKKPNMEFSKCAPIEPKTCHNMNDYKENLLDCVPDCVCLKGFVYDRSKKFCVLPEECSCHHSGKNYQDGDVIDEECSECKCITGKWKCSHKSCEAVCSVWGDSHFTTFDGLSFNFQGACDYYMTKGIDANGNGFAITIQNVLCGSLGVTCSKSLKIQLSGYTNELIQLSSDNVLPKPIYKPNDKNSLIIYKNGVFLVVEDSYIGIQVKWDLGTRVYVKLDNKWKGQVKGLCGDYNEDAMNDMITPSGATETRSTFFGHSWVSKDSCLMPTEPINACKEHPQRETWAQLKCGIIKSDVFKACHATVSYEKFLKNCIFDSCACDQGGDCECLCTAIAAYAHACSQRGIHIKWRTPSFCPMQCDTQCSRYSPCVSPCPIETCDNLLDQGISNLMCKEEKCDEGCQIEPCEEGYIYSNETYLECVPKSKCVPVCIEINGKIYYEGDIVSSTDCQTCHCSKNKVICSGEPCVETNSTCKNGWTKWISEDEFVMKSVSKKSEKMDKLPLVASPSLYGACEKKFMKQIECRTVDTHKTLSETRDSCVCDLINGFKSNPGVKNEYEIRVLCECKLPAHIPITCDPIMKEYKEYPGDCYKFYHCQPQTEGNYGYMEKTCGPSMMFNPKENICDYISKVEIIKPECSKPFLTSTPKPVIVTPGPVKPLHYEQKTNKPITTTEKLLNIDTTKPPFKKVVRYCDVNVKQYEEYNGDCQKFLQCSIQTDGQWVYVEKVCGPGMLFNPNHNICDHKQSVVKIKPECEKSFSKPTGKASDTASSIYYHKKNTTEKVIASTESLKYSVSASKQHMVDTTQNPIQLLGGHCDVNDKQYREYFGDCQKFLHCTMQYDGLWIYVEKVCGHGTLFNPTNNICDHISKVILIKPECGVEPEAYENHILTNEVVPDVSQLQVETDLLCPVGQKWTSCSNRCKKSCHFYEKSLIKEGICRSKEKCKPGCVEDKIPDCAAEGKFWRDASKCVAAEDCPCMNTEGGLVKPHQTYTEVLDESKLCQCLDNQYVCQEPVEHINITEFQPEVTGQETLNFDINLPKRVRVVPVIIKNYVCSSKRFVPIINSKVKPMPDTVFSASSSKSDKHLPNYARYDSKFTWSPKINDKSEYLQIKLPKPEKVFGILLQGSPNDDEFVTLYQVLYSNDGEAFHMIMDKKGKQQLFSGPIDSENPVKTVLKVPIEASIIRIYPLKWHEAIAIQVELFGCDETESIVFAEAPTIIQPFAPDVAKVTKTPLSPFVTTKKPFFKNKLPLIEIEKKTTKQEYFMTVDKKTNESYVSHSHVIDKTTTWLNSDTNVHAEPFTKKPYYEKLTSFKTTQKPFKDAAIKKPFIVTQAPITTIEQVKVTTKKSYIVTEAPIVPICEESMGVLNDQMRPEQVKASSKFTDGTKKLSQPLIKLTKLNSTEGWRPAVNSANEFIKFDFIEPRKLTGIKTLGGPLGWVTAFRVMFSNDGRAWNNVLDSSGGKFYVGNQGPDILKVNFFEHPVKARYLKIHPEKWEKNINIKIEPLGCFEPYPFVPAFSVPEIKSGNCSVCEGVMETVQESKVCKCILPKLWDGKACVSQNECPCVDDYITYPLGAKFETRDCEECVCVLGGTKQCKPKKCPPCAMGLRPVKHQQCLCLCEQCPVDSRICPSSGDCIKKTEWCDGIKNCEDDESDECQEIVQPITEVSLSNAMCMWEGKSYKIGDKWTSSDNCTSYMCKEYSNKYSVDSYHVTCPPVDCEANMTYKDGCCLRCKMKPDSIKNCAAAAMELPDTVKLIAKYDKLHSLCINMKPIVGFTECIGHCSSGMKFSKVTGVHESHCDCCKALSYRTLVVPLTCEDGFVLKKEIMIPERCECNACKEDNPQLKQTFLR